LYETALAMQQSDLSNAEMTTPVLEQLEEILLLFETHAHSEDHHFNEPLEQTNPEVASMFEKEHEEDHRLANVLGNLLSSYRAAGSAEERAKQGKLLFYAFNEFIVFNLYHMNQEEKELNATLWKRYSDQEIKGIEQKIVQNTPPQKMSRYAKWMIRGLNDREIIHWLGEVRDFAPAPVFQMLIGIAEKELTSERYEGIATALKVERNVTNVFQ